MGFPLYYSLLQLIIGILIFQPSSCTQLPIGSILYEEHPSYQNTKLISLHKHLIELESITGNEKAVGNWLFDYLKDHGLTVEKQDVAKDRFNILAYPGDSAQTKVLVTSHIDTVPPYIPYSTQNGTIYGRGSVDAKSCVAAQIIAVLDVLSIYKSQARSYPSVSLLFVVGEEKGGEGMKHFSDHPANNYSAVIFGEPTEGKLATGHKGMLSFNIIIKGKASHSGYPWLGLSANALIIEALAALVKLESHLPQSEKLGKSTLNIGFMKGGVAANVIAAEAEAEISVRIAGGLPEEVKEMVNATLKETREKATSKGGSLEVIYSDRAYGPIDIDTDIPKFDTIGVNYGTDIPNLKGNHKRYLYGPGSILVAHGADEQVKIRELEDAAKAYKSMITYLLDH